MEVKNISLLPIVLGIVFLIMPCILSQAATLDNLYRNGKYNHPYLNQADSLADKNLPNKALEAYKSAFESFIREDNYIGQITAACSMAIIYSNFGAYDSAEFILTKAKYIFKGSGKDSILLADIYFRVGILHDYQNQPDSALDYHNKALKIRKKKYGEISESVASSYNAIAEIYRYTFLDYFTAENYYQKALGITEKLTTSDQSKNLATICYSLATTYRLKGDTEKAITYATQSYTYYSKNNAEDYLNFSLCFNVLANIYFEKSQFKESLTFFHKAVSNMQKVPQYFPMYITTFYTNMGAAFSELDRSDSALYYSDSALYYLNKALIILKKKENPTAELSHTYNQIGFAYVKKDPDSALYYFEKSLMLSQEIFGEDHAETARIYFDIGDYYHFRKNYKPAIENIQKSLKILSYDSLLNIQKNFQSTDLDVNTIMECLAKKASSQLQLYYQSHQKQYLKDALNDFLALDEILNKFRHLIIRENSKLDLAKNFKYSYEEALNCAYELIKTEPDEPLAASIFKLMESNKSLVMLDFLNNAEIIKSLGIPDSIRAQEQSLQARLHFYTAELYESPGDSSKVLHEKIFYTERQLEKLKQKLSLEYPEYYHFNFSQSNYSVDEIRNYLQRKDAVFVEYFFGDSALFILGLNTNLKDAKFLKINNIPELDTLTNTLLKSFYQDMTINNINQDFKHYTETASKIYIRILSPILGDKKFLNSNHLIIVPDGILSFIPFEALISERPELQNSNYNSLAYLIKNFSISYSFSGQVLLEINQDYRKNIFKTLVFSYSQAREKINSITGTSIKGSADEAEYIAELMPSTIFSGSNATKENFKKHANEAGIIHLALHGVTDNENPLKGSLVFRSKENSGNLYNDNLYYHELLSMKFNARLAVLSACETGVGMDHKGEGVYNIARGFRYAGCPTLLSSLWKINDQSTAVIIKKFYEELSLHKDLNIALQSSKLDYIKNADEFLAHPRFWAGLLLIGETTPIKINEKNEQWLYWICLFVLIVILACVLMSQKKLNLNTFRIILPTFNFYYIFSILFFKAYIIFYF